MFADISIAEAVVALFIGYAFGAIPFGLVITRLGGLGDIRSIGSGNIGATNVLRTGRKDLALATLLLDGGKGAIAVVVVRLISDGSATEVLALLAGFGAVVGHNFPIWLGFKGGKGVATTLGMIIASIPLVGGIAVATWLVVAAIFRMSSLAALIALLAAPVTAYILGYPIHAAAFFVLAAMGWARHHANIARLLKGTEPKIGAKKTEA